MMKVQKNIRIGIRTVVIVALIAALAVAVIGCGKKTDEAKVAASNKVYQIGVIQPVEHPSLNLIYQGFQDEMKAKGYGDKIKLDYQNAQGDPNTINTIAANFVADKKDLILAIATNPAQACAGQTTTIPIIGAGITSFTDAGLAQSNEAPGANVTGTSDAAPVDTQVALITDLVPHAQTVGFLYSSGESNAVEQVKQMEAAVKKKGLAVVEQTVANSNDVQQATQALVKKCDIVYIPTDNTIASAMPLVIDSTNAAKIPVIPGATAMVEQGGLATAGVDQEALGRVAADMAIEVLEGKGKPATMPIQTLTHDSTIVINTRTAKLLGLTIPKKYASATLYDK